MDRLVHSLIGKGVADSTLRAYISGKKRYMEFCDQFRLLPLPVDEVILLRFVAHLASLGLSYQTVKLYLSAVRHLQIMSDLPDPSVAAYPRLNYALRGLHRRVAEKGQLTRLPITPEMLAKIHRFWSQSPSTFEHVLLWAAFCLGFFGFMHSGEFTCSSMKEFALDMLTPQDVAVDSHTAPSHIVIHLKRSKNDPFGVGAWLHLGATGQRLCPVAALLGYLAVRPPLPGPLFLFRDGTTLSKPRLIGSLRQVLGEVGVDSSRYSGHSFRIRAATAAAKLGVSDSMIKALGRWKSSAFTRYIQTPWEQLAQMSGLLSGGVSVDSTERISVDT